MSPQKTYIKLQDAEIPVLSFAADSVDKVPEAITNLRTGVFKDACIGYIPESCKIHLEKIDPVGYLDIMPSSYRTDQPEDSGLWDFVKTFRKIARDTGAEVSDEANWSLKVFSPMLEYCAVSRSKLVDVTTQNIDSEFAPKVDTGKIEKRIDYIMCLSINDPQEERLYTKVRKAQLALGPMSQPPTRDQVAYLGIEVKPAVSMKLVDPLLQLMTWTSALHAANHVLIERALFNRTRNRISELQIKITAMPTIGCTVVGHDWSFYSALRTPAERILGYTGDEIRVINVGPLPALECSTTSYDGVFKLIHILKKINDWGVNTYWPWLRDEVLNHFTTVRDNAIGRQADYALGSNSSDLETEDLIDMSVELKPTMSHKADVYTMHMVTVADDELEALISVQTVSAAIHAHMHQLFSEDALHTSSRETLAERDTSCGTTNHWWHRLGHNWQFYIMWRMPSECSIEQSGVAQVICVPVPQLEASTKTFRGVFKLIKILGRIATWAE
ncbi:hypothetical protein MMC11_006991 [Xylographa trunciseda]|nr:hypothetical protein [Xylographa trunciseda]